MHYIGGGVNWPYQHVAGRTWHRLLTAVLMHLRARARTADRDRGALGTINNVVPVATERKVGAISNAPAGQLIVCSLALCF